MWYNNKGKIYRFPKGLQIVTIQNLWGFYKMMEYTKKAIAELTAEEIATAEKVLILLENISYELKQGQSGETYRHRLQIIESDVRHIKELI